ncbi:MAG: ABC transporter substrate-binding protein [Treponema sp.]|nr:ABC transporter substrate-binding protein [Treponema sp.]MCL2237626.1 ABC transporter substrate-binding protein [Treponema sp.]
MKNHISILFLFSLVAAAVFAVNLSGCAKKEPKDLTIVKGVLTVGVEVGYPPMEYYDTDGKTLLGFDIELVKTLAAKLNLEVDFIDTTWEGILAGLDADRYDIAVNVTILPERQERYNFTRPYIDSSMTVAALKNSPIRIERPQDIARHKAAYQGGTTAQYFTERLRDQGLVFTSFSYDKIINCFNDLRLRRVDLVVADNIVGYYYANAQDTPFEIIWEGPSDEYIGICLKKGNDALTAALDNALEELFNDGTMLLISQRIFGRDLVSRAGEYGRN